ncbi:hypothetical protein ACHAXS_009193 [Conticribra weissflogii]
MATQIVVCLSPSSATQLNVGMTRASPIMIYFPSMYHVVDGSVVPGGIPTAVPFVATARIDRAQLPARTRPRQHARPAAHRVGTTARRRRERFLLRTPPRRRRAADAVSGARSRSRSRRLAAAVRCAGGPPGLASLASAPRPRGQAVRLRRGSAVDDVMLAVGEAVVVVVLAGSMHVSRTRWLLWWRRGCSALDHWMLLLWMLVLVLVLVLVLELVIIIHGLNHRISSHIQSNIGIIDFGMGYTVVYVVW